MVKTKDKKESKSSSYSAEQIVVLEGLDPVRKRPAMYIGSTSQTGVHHCLTEIIDNSVDEALAGFAKNIWVIIHQDNSITVIDDGRGIPVDKVPKYNRPALEIVMTKLHAGGKFDSRAYKVSGGLHGVGSSVVNALSEWMEVSVARDAKFYSQKYARGKTKSEVAKIDKIAVLEDKNIPQKFRPQIQNGTISSFLLDKEIFKDGISCDYDTVRRQVKERAYLISGLFFHLLDQRDGREDHFYFEGGISALAEALNRNKTTLHAPIFIQKQEGDIEVAVSVQYTDTLSENVESFVNVINTVDGGTHLTGFRMALTRSINDYGKKMGAFKNGNENISGDDAREGLTAVVYVKMPSQNLQFEGQTKGKLGNAEVQPIVQTVVNEGLDMYFEEHPADGRRILEKVLLAQKARLAAKAAKDAIIRKGALEGATLPGKLADCQSRKPEESELYIVEGDSAGGCFSENTKIALTDGRNLSFTDLIKEHQSNKQNYCYTILKNGNLGIAPIKNPRLTKTKTEVIKVILDNDEEIMVTPDHLFMLRDGTFKAARDLTANDSLMPFKRQLSRLGKHITIAGYEMVFDPFLNRWLFTHLLADQYNLTMKKYKETSGDHRHHLDFNKLNNNPDNLARLSKDEHLRLHQQILEKTLHRWDVKEKIAKLHQTEEFRNKIRQAMSTPQMKKHLSDRAKKQWANPTYKKFMLNKFLEFYRNNIEYQEKNEQKLNSAQKKYWSEEKNKTEQSRKTSEFFRKHPEAKEKLKALSYKQWSDPDLRKWRSNKTKQQWTQEFRIKRKATYDRTYFRKALSSLHHLFLEKGTIDEQEYQKLRKTSHDKSLIKYETICFRFFNGDEEMMKQAIKNFNHRIKKIISMRKKIDVFDLEVPETHNFALAAGIFVHNSAKQGRDRKFQAILPLRGKILNTERARLDKILEFSGIKDLIIALGMGIAESLTPEKLRYHRIIIMTDADVDGKHIRTLLLTFFYRHLPYVISNHHLYIAQPPLFKVAIGKQIDFAYDDHELEKILNKHRESKLTPTISRYKGLGEMNPDQLWETTMNPVNRILKIVALDDATNADEVFSMLMGDEVAPRKRFIQTHAKTATLDI